MQSNIKKYEIPVDIEELSNYRIYDDIDHNSILFNNILDMLSPIQKRVIKERYLNDRSFNEIASKLGITRQAVNGLKNRALKNVKKYIQTIQ